MFEVRIEIHDPDATLVLSGPSSSSTAVYCETYNDAHSALDSILAIHGLSPDDETCFSFAPQASTGTKVDPKKGPKDF